MTTINRDDLTRVPGSVKPDTKRRIVLPSSLVREDITYHIYHNRVGQIILDPQVTIPASETWLFQNPEALALVDQGMTESSGTNRGSFAKYVKNAP